MKLERHRWAVRAALLVAVAAAFAGALLSRAGATAYRGRVVDDAFVSRGLAGPLRYEAFLPAGYRESRRRYPVVYFLHGLPADPDTYKGAAFVAEAIEAVGGQAIVVAPQGARHPNGDPEYHDWGAGRNWETAIAEELPKVIDARFRTIPTRAGRALIGLSAGGYGATILGLHHLSEYSVIESWSGYFHATNPDGTEPLDLGSPGENAYASAHSIVSRLRARFAQYPTFLGFYVGQGDSLFRPENEQFDRELTRAGVRHVFAEYPGGHEQSLWSAHAPVWLGFALRHLAAAR